MNHPVKNKFFVTPPVGGEYVVGKRDNGLLDKIQILVG